MSDKTPRKTRGFSSDAKSFCAHISRFGDNLRGNFSPKESTFRPHIKQICRYFSCASQPRSPSRGKKSPSRRYPSFPARKTARRAQAHSRPSDPLPPRTAQGRFPLAPRGRGKKKTAAFPFPPSGNPYQMKRCRFAPAIRPKGIPAHTAEAPRKMRGGATLRHPFDQRQKR